MAKKKKIELEEASEEEGGRFLSNLLTWMKESRSLILTAFILIPFIILIFLVDQKVSKAKTYLFDDSSLSIQNDLPQWILDYGLENKIKLNKSRVRETYVGKSYFDKSVLKNIHSSMIKNAWLKEVHLSKKMPNKIHVHVTFREPKISFLIGKKFWYYLDEDLKLLPPKERNGSEEIPVVRIRGVVFTKKESGNFKPGLQLKKRALQKSIQLIEDVSAREEISVVLKEIRISYLRNKTTPRFKLFFENGLEVLWGEFLFDQEIDGFPSKQLTTDEKLDQLTKKLIKRPNTLYCNVEYKN